MQDGECLTVIELHTIAFGHVSFEHFAVLVELLTE